MSGCNPGDNAYWSMERARGSNEPPPDAGEVGKSVLEENRTECSEGDVSY